MDRLDVSILREMYDYQQAFPLMGPKNPLRAIAKKVGVDKDTVRSRIKRFQERGFLQGWAAYPNPSLLGVKGTTLQFDAPSPASKDDLIRKLRLLQGVIVIVVHYGSSIATILWYETEQSLKRITELISRISNTENLIRYDTPIPECKITLSEIDWKIIKSLQQSPSKSYKLISSELGISSRTVKRRLSRLVEGRAVIVLPRINQRAIDGTVVDLLVFYANPERRSEVDQKIVSRFDDHLLRAELVDKNHGLFNLIITNVATAHQISSWMKEQSGISRYRVDLVQDRIEQYGVLSELVEKKLAQIRLAA